MWVDPSCEASLYFCLVPTTPNQHHHHASNLVSFNPSLSVIPTTVRMSIYLLNLPTDADTDVEVNIIPQLAPYETLWMHGHWLRSDNHPPIYIEDSCQLCGMLYYKLLGCTDISVFPDILN